MKVSALTIAGFKSVTQKAYISLAPITLLLGANSISGPLSLYRDGMAITSMITTLTETIRDME